MELFHLQGLTFFYPDQEQAALRDVSQSVRQGEFITLCGPSGCGKTTLLRQLKPTMTPFGRCGGDLFFEGRPISSLTHREQSEHIGFVLQSPDNQLVTDKVWHEMAFGLESLGLDSNTIRLRVAETASYFGIEDWFHKNVNELSGGQKQLLNLAAVMAMQPKVLLLDEPTSQLDPIAGADFLATVGRLNRELGVTVLLTEHRLEDALPLSHRCVVMEAGQIIADGPPDQVGQTLRERGHHMFGAMPTPMRVWAATPSPLPSPITVQEGRDWLSGYADSHPVAAQIPPRPVRTSSPAALVLEEVWFRYRREDDDVVRGLSLTVEKGELLALLGGNGAGKTTLLGLISGNLRPTRGKVRCPGGRLGVLPQDPQALFVKDTVRADLGEMGIGKGAWQLDAVVALCNLEGLLDRHPHDLSGGEAQRAALAKVLLMGPDLLLLDEPTKGMDAAFKENFAGLLRDLQAQGVTLLMVSHDVEFCAKYADRCAMLFDGGIAAQGAPRDFFSGNTFYTTAASRMSRHLVEGAVTAEEVAWACTGREHTPPPKPETTPAPNPAPPPEERPAPRPLPVESPETSSPRRTLVVTLLTLVLISLTVFAGTAFLHNRKYFVISLLVIAETLVPFFLLFEGRRPKARELVILAVLCAIGVAGRAAFFMAPNFKPVAAVVIVAAIAFGPESGFMVGAVTMFLSNMLLSQGPWTPWQMFAMGLIGFLAGVLFHKRALGRDRLVLCIFGFLTTFLLYGVIMNVSSVFLYQENPTLPMLFSVWALGIPMDLIHGGATVFFLWAAGLPLLQKLERVKEKYGMMTA